MGVLHTNLDHSISSSMRDPMLRCLINVWKPLDCSQEESHGRANVQLIGEAVSYLWTLADLATTPQSTALPSVEVTNTNMLLLNILMNASVETLLLKLTSLLLTTSVIRSVLETIKRSVVDHGG